MEATEQAQSQKITYADKTIPSYVLDDLSSRFIINSRPEDFKSIIRIFFLVENAFWFYLDYHRVDNPELKECTLKEFAYNLISHCPQIKQFIAEFDKHFDAWRQYKKTIATCGAIILDKELKHVLLVQSFTSKNSWGFPKGKINQNEALLECAAREVLEETGFDIKPYADQEEYLEKCTNEQINRLYIVAGVPLNTSFLPKTRREIRDIQWFPIDALPTHKGDQTLKEAVGQNLNLYTVTPFLKSLKMWIKNYQAEASFKHKGRLKQQKQFASLALNQYQEFIQLKKGKLPTKNVISQRSTSVRYSREFQDKDIKQGKRGMTVVQSLFGNRDSQTVVEFKAPQVDTNSFYSQAWYNFRVDVDAIEDMLPHEGSYYFPKHFDVGTV
ncbi:hypothetical protein BsWGS_01543 [Bradybaena similaris]